MRLLLSTHEVIALEKLLRFKQTAFIIGWGLLLFTLVLGVSNWEIVFAEDNTVTVTHELGQAVVKKNPKKVIVFDYATLDSLDQMGIEILGLPKSNIPEYLSKFRDKRYADVGTLFEPNFERIYELRPDVIFISSRQSAQYDELQKIAPTVYLVVDPKDYLGSFSKNLRVLGEIFEKEDFVKQELAAINDEIKKVREQVTRSSMNALVLMANDGSLSAFGAGSRFGMVHKEFGFPPADPNIEVVNHGQSVSFEYLVKTNPDFLLVIDRAATVGGSISAKQVLDNPLVKMTDAAQSDRIIYLTSQVWYAASGGLEGTKIMIEDIQKAVEKLGR